MDDPAVWLFDGAPWGWCLVQWQALAFHLFWYLLGDLIVAWAAGPRENVGLGVVRAAASWGCCERTDRAWKVGA